MEQLAYMIKIKLLDGTVKSFNAPVSGIELANSISKSLSKIAIAMKVNDSLCDLGSIISHDSNVEIITIKDEIGLDILRHDAAHTMAQAVQELFPGTKLAIGPTIQDGFYYDFDSAHTITLEDLPRIEEKMHQISKQNLAVKREVLSKSQALNLFQKLGEKYKEEIINSLPSGEEITAYKQGEFIDLCKGPHAPSTGSLKVFKLLKISGAYWRGDSSKKMLQRIYGTAWATEEDLKAYLMRLEEAQKRDHRKLGKEMDLFHMEEIAPGTVFWHPKGWTLFRMLVEYMRKKQEALGYLEIATPEIMDRQLWIDSGHADKFDAMMYKAEVADEHKSFMVRPMNCPGGTQVFKDHLRSYRELPMKIAEFGKVYRYEPSGSLHGLFRARGFTQDDAHIFCTEAQIEEQAREVCELVKSIYKDFGFDNLKIKFADRPDKRIGSDQIWDKAEDALKNSALAAGLEFSINKGEGAFYGPKLEFVLQDALGRDWQLGTLQLDLNLPERLDVNYITSDGGKLRPVMLHRAILGSFERFIGILLEHYAGNLPLWIAPLQIVLAPISNHFDDYAAEVLQLLRANKIRAEADLSSEKISYKLRKHSMSKVPIIAIIGQNEVQNRTVTLRRLGVEEQETLILDDFLNKIKKEAKLN